MQQDMHTIARAAHEDREREVAAIRAEWPEPTGVRLAMRRLAVRVRGRETQEHLERTWRFDRAQRALRTTRGW